MKPQIRQPTDKTRTARAEASAWIIRLHSESRTPELEAGLRDWLTAAPENARAFELITDTWELAGTLAPHELPRTRAARHSPGRTGPLTVAVAATILCALGLYVAYRIWAADVYATNHAEQRLIRLTDGTHVTLNSDTRLLIRYSSNRRNVQLEQGEAYFEVAPNPAAPFTVSVGDRRVTALGTSFIVRVDDREEDTVAVTLIDGKVAVTSATGQRTHSSDTPASPLYLSPGERVTLRSKGAAPALDNPHIEALTAWRRGEVLLESTPLRDAIAEMNRYDSRQVILDDPRLATIAISGIYRTGDSAGFARAVAELNELEVTENAYTIHLAPPTK